MAQEDAIARLARQIDAARKAERLVVSSDQVAGLRRLGASELHRICADFATSVNSQLPEAVDLSPATFSPEMFRETGANLIQISAQGREMHIVFEAPAKLVSTDKFLVPYVLEGEVRAFNQRMLERFEIRSRLLFYCVDQGTAGWRFYDWRTLHTGPVDRDLLVSLMQPLF
jgi:hypothetical protein